MHDVVQFYQWYKFHSLIHAMIYFLYGCCFRVTAVKSDQSQTLEYRLTLATFQFDSVDEPFDIWLGITIGLTDERS